MRTLIYFYPRGKSVLANSRINLNLYVVCCRQEIDFFGKSGSLKDARRDADRGRGQTSAAGAFRNRKKRSVSRSVPASIPVRAQDLGAQSAGSRKHLNVAGRDSTIDLEQRPTR